MRTDLPKEGQVVSLRPSTPWHYDEAVACARPKVGQYLEITEGLLHDLSLACDVLGQGEQPGQRTKRSFADFCEAIGISTVVAERWLRKSKGKGGTSKSKGGKPQDGVEHKIDKSAPSPWEIVDRIVASMEKRLDKVDERRSPSVNNDVMTVREAAGFVRCDESLLVQSIDKGEIVGYWLGSELRLLREDLIEWLKLLPNSRVGRSGRTGGISVKRAVARAEASSAANTATGSPSKSTCGVESLPKDDLGEGGKLVLPILKRGAKISVEQKQQIKQWIVAAVTEGKGITDAVRDAGIAWSTFHDWRKNDAEFGVAIKTARGW